MSRIVTHNNVAYLCGQVALDDSADIRGQTATMLVKVDALLDSVGSERAKILSATIYLKTMADFKVMNQVWENWVATPPPARACVEASMADEALLVEISVIAAI